ncbi:MAG: hypothetical protein ACRDB1_09130 [Microcoleaceae cyanobacterium]
MTSSDEINDQELGSDNFLQGSRRGQVYQNFLKQEIGFDKDNLAFLDRSIKKSPYVQEIPNFPQYLKETPNFPLSLEEKIAQHHRQVFSPYPLIGEMPLIDEDALNFLHPDIKHACIAIGGWQTDQLKVQWLGRNALDTEQYWSSTKIIPILNIVSRIQAENIEKCRIKGKKSSWNFFDIVDDILTYDENIDTSNSLTASLKRFLSFADWDKWLHSITGNQYTKFQSFYGEAPAILNPILLLDDQILLKVPADLQETLEPLGENLLTAYDMTRFFSLVGWHEHLYNSQHLPGMTSEKLAPVVKSFGKDKARYVDVALDQLNLTKEISQPVILSKLGQGFSSVRQRTEIVYSAYVQFTYQEKVWTIALTLRGARALGDDDRQGREADARIATEVTEILRRLISGELVR